MHIRRIAVTTTVGIGLLLAGAGPALAAPPIGASCAGQFNGFINPLVHGTGRLNSQDVHDTTAAGLRHGQLVKQDAQTHGVDCANVPPGFPLG
jgi:hypothetical protein